MPAGTEFDPDAYAERIWENYYSGAIGMDVRNALLSALDNGAVGLLVTGGTNTKFPPFYLESVACGLDRMLGFYLTERTGNVHADNQGESAPERYRGKVPGVGGGPSCLADRAGGARKGKPSAD